MSKTERLRWRLLQAAAVILLLFLACFLFLRSWIKVPDLPGLTQTDNTVDVSMTDSSVSFSGAEIPDIALSGRKEGVYTFLIAGRDTASGSTDTMLLITYDTKEKTLHGLNLPRDTMINVSTTSKRLNAVYSYNRGKDKETQVEKGMTALKAQVAKLTGITPDFYVLVEWEAIGKLVDALGGVEFEVPYDMDYDDPYQDLHIHQKAGLRVLSGDDAMQVIRHRKNNDGSHSNGDVGRLQVQQSFLMAVAKKCLQPATFLKVPSLAQIFTENVATDLTVGNILAFAQLAYGMDAEEGVSFSTAPLAADFLYRGASLVTLDGEQLLEVLNADMNPYLRDIRLDDLELLVRQSNGSFRVTSGTLADERMGQASSSNSSGSSSNTSSNSNANSNSGSNSNQTTAANQTTTTDNSTATSVPDDTTAVETPEVETPDTELPTEANPPDTEEPDQNTESIPEPSGENPEPAAEPVPEIYEAEQSTPEDTAAQTETTDGTFAVLPSRPQPAAPAA
jgi:LCP family protein required for cell wall assembly